MGPSGRRGRLPRSRLQIARSHVQTLGDAAIFAHRVLTRSTSNGGEIETDERETIVFQRQLDRSWLAVHEHLSPTPTTA